jgi:hypothetical protein
LPLPSGPPNWAVWEVEEQHLRWVIENANCKKMVKGVKLRQTVVLIFKTNGSLSREYILSSRTALL